MGCEGARGGPRRLLKALSVLPGRSCGVPSITCVAVRSRSAGPPVRRPLICAVGVGGSGSRLGLGLCGWQRQRTEHPSGKADHGPRAAEHEPGRVEHGPGAKDHNLCSTAPGPGSIARGQGPVVSGTRSVFRSPRSMFRLPRSVFRSARLGSNGTYAGGLWNTAGAGGVGLWRSTAASTLFHAAACARIGLYLCARGLLLKGNRGMDTVLR